MSPHSLFHHENVYVYCTVDVVGTAPISLCVPQGSGGGGVPHPHAHFDRELPAFWLWFILHGLPIITLEPTNETGEP